MYSRVTEEESAVYELSVRFGREVIRRVSHQQLVDIVYDVHVDRFLKKVMAEAMKKAWKRVFDVEIGQDEQTMATIEKMTKIFRQQSQKAYEKFYLVKVVGEA